MIELPLLTIISGLLTIGVRLSGLMLFAPWFGNAVIPARIKAGLVLALTLLLFPSVGRGIGTYSMGEWPMLVISEFLIGVGMGIATNIVFEATQLAGEVLGIQMGYSLVNILDPLSQQTRRAEDGRCHTARRGRECIDHLGEGSGQAAGCVDMERLRHAGARQECRGST